MSGSSLRFPALTVLAGSAPLPNVIDADISNNAHFGAGRFRLHVAAEPAIAASLLQPGTVLDLQCDLGGPTVSLIQGEADSISIDVLNGALEIHGRDLTARFLDARTQETFTNQTSSEIAQTLAGRRGLGANITPTSTLAGRYYEAEHNRITLGQFSRSVTEWDLLTFLAAREGFEVFVADGALTFGPADTAAPAVNLTPDMCVSLRLEHALTLARDIEVTVKSWNTRQQSAFTQTARAKANGAGSSSPQKILVVRPNLYPADALQLAQRILADLSAHERVVHAELPGELTLTPRTPVQFSGTGTDFDQIYHVAEIDRHFSSHHGFTERLRLKTIPQIADAT